MSTAIKAQFNPGDKVRINGNVPEFAGRVGRIQCVLAAFINPMPLHVRFPDGSVCAFRTSEARVLPKDGAE